MKGGDRWGEVWSASLGGVGQWPRRLREQGREIAPCWGHGGDDDDEDGDDGDGDNDDDGYDDNGDETKRGEGIPSETSLLSIDSVFNFVIISNSGGGGRWHTGPGCESSHQCGTGEEKSVTQVFFKRFENQKVFIWH